MDQEKRGPKRPPPKAAARSVANLACRDRPGDDDCYRPRPAAPGKYLQTDRRGDGIHPSYAFKLVEQGIELTISRPAETVPVSHFLGMGQRDT